MIVSLCAKHGYFCKLVPVPEHDVLARYAWIAKIYDATYIVRCTADCPLIDPYILATVLVQWEAMPGLAYLGMGPGWPDGVADYDLFTREALFEAAAMDLLPSEREHLAPAFWHSPDLFRQMTYPAPAWVRARQWPKLSVDTPEDLHYVAQVAQAVTARYSEAYTWIDVLRTIETTPALQRAPEPMNAAYVAQVAQELGTTAQAWDEVRYGRGDVAP